jgi:hypothetical protein
VDAAADGEQETARRREPRRRVAIQCKVQWIALSASPPRNDKLFFSSTRWQAVLRRIVIRLTLQKQIPRHREPRSGVAIQCRVQWIAASASPPRNDKLLFSSTRWQAALRRIVIRLTRQKQIPRHREPRSGVAIQCKVQCIAASAFASSQRHIPVLVQRDGTLL